MEHRRAAALLLAPARLLPAVFALLPLLFAFALSFQHYNVMHSTWAGLDNYRRVLVDPIVSRALVNTPAPWPAPCCCC